MALIFQALGMTPIAWYEHIILGGFCFGAVFMATDPVTSARTEKVSTSTDSSSVPSPLSYV